MQLGAYIRKAGFTPWIMDNAFHNGTDDGIRATVGTEIQPEVIGIGGMTMQRNDGLRIARVIRAMGLIGGRRPLMVAGGVHFTFCPNDAYELFDLVVIGEGEATFLAVLERFKATGSYSGADYADIAGIGYKDPNTPDAFVLSAPRPLLEADKLCPPAFDLVPWLTKYDDGFITGEHVPMLMTGRGCPYDCQFCAAPQLYSRKVRLYPMDMVRDMMLQLKRLYGKSAFRVMDDTFAASNSRVAEFCAMVSKDIGPTRLSCLTHCKTADLATMKLMRDTGFWVVAYGIESGNDEVLKLINKKTTVAEAANAIAITRQAGIAVEALYMLGNIGETEQSILDTINFAVKHNHPSQYAGMPPFVCNWFQFATPFPGSRFFAEANNYGAVTTYNYDAYHHQAPVFIPKGLTAERMMQLREQAFREAR
jgi:radical SAM superfamily enzyme YgiQ (UPF0313 family)